MYCGTGIKVEPPTKAIDWDMRERHWGIQTKELEFEVEQEKSL